MIRPQLDFIRPSITIKSLRDYILKKKLSENDTIFLNTQNFDDIVLEHRDTYRESLVKPYFIISVLIEEDETRQVPYNRIGIIKNDTESIRFIEPYVDTFDDIHQAFRCGWCGNIVDEAGYELDDDQRERIIGYLENELYKPVTTHVNGKCCENEANS